MAMNHDPVAQLGTREWQECEVVLRRFELAWQSGSPPLISAFLPSDSAFRKALLFELVITDIELRFRHGLSLNVEEYLEMFPELVDPEEQLVELIVGEWELQRCRRHDLSLDEYELRFPELISQIRSRVETVPRDRSLGSTPLFGKLRGEGDEKLELGSIAIPGFEIVSVLGQGGMGTVFKARQIELNRMVALKILRTSFSDEVATRRVLLEGEATAALTHENIVQMYSVGSFNQRPYLVLEYINGRTLEEAWMEKLPSPKEVAANIRTLASAIDFAHQRQIVHRDLKPNNVLVEESGKLRIADFGLAKIALNQNSATVTGEILGTPSYMSPEQAAADTKALGPATDIYSLGAILYRGLTGAPPFIGASPFDTMAQVRWSSPVPPRRIQPSLPKDIETICLKCLEKLPQSRYASAADLASDLQNFLEGRPIAARPTRFVEKVVKWSSRQPLIATLVLLLAVTFCSGCYFGLRQWHDAAESLKLAKDRERERWSGLIDSLLSSRPESVSTVLATIRKDRSFVTPLLLGREKQLNRVSTRKSAASHAMSTVEMENRLHLALLESEPDRLNEVSQSLVRSNPAEFLFLRTELEKLRSNIDSKQWAEYEVTLRSVLSDPSQADLSRFHAMLALITPNQPSTFNEFATEIVDRLLDANPIHMNRYFEALAPFPTSVTNHLRFIANDESRSSEHRALAVNLLSEVFEDQADELIDLLLEANDLQYRLILEKVRRFAQEVRPRLERIIEEPIDSNQTPEIFESQMKRIANAAIALFAFGEREKIWPLLRANPRPDLQTALMNQLKLVNPSVTTLFEQIKQESVVSIRQALLLTLGELVADNSLKALGEAEVQVLLAMYKDDPDAGVHSSLRWLLHRIGKKEDIQQADQIFAKEGISANKNWYVTPFGQTMLIVRGPVDYVMGVDPKTLPETERYYLDCERAVVIERSWAIGTLEVSHSEFLRFRKVHTINPVTNPSLEGALGSVTWYDAAKFCRWLSEQEGVAEDQMCYPSLEEIKAGMVLPTNYLSRTGYRLPSEAEWEYSVRAGTVSRNYFGDSNRFIASYGWLRENAARQVHVPGLLKPNAWGLFDGIGNVAEFCQEVEHMSLVAVPSQYDREDTLPVDDKNARTQRGSSISVGVLQARSTDRNAASPNRHFFNGGFRIARSLDRE